MPDLVRVLCFAVIGVVAVVGIGLATSQSWPKQNSSSNDGGQGRPHNKCPPSDQLASEHDDKDNSRTSSSHDVKVQERTSIDADQSTTRKRTLSPSILHRRQPVATDKSDIRISRHVVETTHATSDPFETHSLGGSTRKRAPRSVHISSAHSDIACRPTSPRSLSPLTDMTTPSLSSPSLPPISPITEWSLPTTPSESSPSETPTTTISEQSIPSPQVSSCGVGSAWASPHTPLPVVVQSGHAGVEDEPPTSPVSDTGTVYVSAVTSPVSVKSGTRTVTAATSPVVSSADRSSALSLDAVVMRLSEIYSPENLGSRRKGVKFGV